MKFESGQLLTAGNFQQYVIYNGLIVPNRAIKNNKVFSITHKTAELHLTGFIVILDNNKVSGVLLLGSHPNQDENLYYCLPDSKKYKEFTKEYYGMLLNNICTYYLDDCYFDPTDNLRFKELTSFMKIQF